MPGGSKKSPTANFRGDYATNDDFCNLFEEDMKALYLLAFLLTANHTESEQCFVSTIEKSFKEEAVFKEWVRPWVKRRLIKSAIEIVSPSPARGGPKPDLWILGRRGTSGEIGIDIITKLAPFERFVFVMSILERYSNRECSLLLGCDMQTVAQARTRTFCRFQASPHCNREELAFRNVV